MNCKINKFTMQIFAIYFIKTSLNIKINGMNDRSFTYKYINDLKEIIVQL